MTTKISTTNIQDTALTTLLGPKVTTIVYPGDDTATDTAGGQTINLTGNGFQSGCSVLVGSTASSVVTFISTTQISFTAPAMAANTYVIYVINPDGGTAISIPGISYSGTPTWSTSAGTLGTAYETGAISATLTATGDAPITYSLVTGTLPTGSTLNSNGTISGTAVATASVTTYSFTIKASDAQNQDTNRAFSITINPDVVTWSSPASLTTYNVNTNTAIANVTMSATSASGGSITYTADTLPSGLSITGANIAGTPTVAASTTTVLTATATSTRTATRTINWVVSVANDTYFKNTTLLLNGETTVTPFISDASTNSLGLTINGDTKPTLFNPYTPGYYSNYFDGSGDYLTAPSNAAFQFGTGDFTVEAWIYTTVSSGTQGIFDTRTSDGSTTGIFFGTYSTNTLLIYTSATLLTGGSITINTWTHIAVVRSGTTVTGYINGISVVSGTRSNNFTDTNIQIGGSPLVTSSTANYFTGYISNLRVIKGTALYTTTFAPSTTPLTAITNTSLLTCQSNRFIDNSTNNFTLTKNGDTLISPNIPFTQNASYSTYGSTYFDGTGDYLTAPNNSAFQFGTGDFTIECMVNFTGSAMPSNAGIFHLANSYFPATQSGLAVAYQAQTTNAFTAYYATSSANVNIGPTLYPNTWNHVALVRTGTSLLLFVNGVSYSLSASDSTNYSYSYLVMGGYYSTSYLMTGYISNFRVVKGTAVYTTTFTPPTSPLTAITNTQLLTLQYNGGATNQGIIDNSNFNNIITRSGNTSQGSFSPYSQTGFSNLFGVADYFQLPTSTSAFQFLTNNFTIECWVYLNSAVTAANRMLWYNYVSSFTTDSVFFGGHASFNGQVVFYAYNLNAGAAPILTDPTVLTPYVWTHLAVVRNGNNFTLYRNGVSVSTATFSGSTVGNTWVYGGYIGTSGTSSINGYLSNFRIVNGTAVYTGAFTPPTAPLTAITNTAILTSQSNRFIDNSPNNVALTVNGTISVQAYSPFGSISEATPLSYSNYFNTDYFSGISSSASPSGTGSWTVECWFYQTSRSSGTGRLVDGDVQWTTAVLSTGEIYGETSNGASSKSVTGTVVTLNTWHHMALVKNSSTVTLYYDGIAQGSSWTESLSLSAVAMNIGGKSTGSTTRFLGYISNARIVNGTAVYTSAFTPPTSPLTAIANTTLLTCQSTTIKDSSSTTASITVNGSPTVYKYNPFGYTAQSATSYTPSLHGGSAYFDGTGDGLSTPNNAGFKFGTGDFTVEFWLYDPGIKSGSDYIYLNAAAYGNWGLIKTAHVLYWQDYIAGNSVVSGPNISSLGLYNTWIHIAAVRKSSSSTIYVNGVGYGTTADTRDYQGTGALTIGLLTNYGATQAYISDIRITNGISIYKSNFIPPTQTLTNYSTTYPSSLLLNFTNGGIVDAHSSNNHETVNNVQLSTSVKKYGNSSISFNGTNQQLTSYQVQNVQFGSGNWTVEFWAYFNSLAGAQVFANYGYDTSTTRSWILYINVGVMRIAQSTDGSANVDASLGTPSLTTGVWNHFAFVRNGGVITLYVNGVSTGTTATAYTLAALSTTYYFKIGGDTTNFFNGYMDDFRVTKGYARYTANFTAPTSALITK